MDCYTLGQTVAHKAVAVARTVYHPIHHGVGRGIHAASHIVPSTKSGAVRMAPRIACRPPAGFLAGMAKAAGIAIVGAPLLGSPTSPDSISGVAAALNGIPNPGIASSVGDDASAAFAGPGQTASTSAPAASPNASQTAGSAIATPLPGDTELSPTAFFDTPSPQPIPFAVPLMQADMPAAFGPTTTALLAPSGPPPVTQAVTAQILQPVPVPEPPASLLLATALLVLARRRRLG